MPDSFPHGEVGNVKVAGESFSDCGGLWGFLGAFEVFVEGFGVLGVTRFLRLLSFLVVFGGFW